MPTRIFEMSREQQANATFANLRNVPWNAAQEMTATGTSAQSAAFQATTNAVSVQSDEDVLVEFGANPTAAAGSFKIAAGETHDFWVVPGHKLAVITA